MSTPNTPAPDAPLRDRRRNTRWQWALIWIMALVVIGGVIVLTYSIVLTARETRAELARMAGPAPLAYDKQEYPPVQQMICPGRTPTGEPMTLTYRTTFTVADAGTGIRALRNFWNVNGDQPGGAAARDRSGLVVQSIIEERTLPAALAGMPRASMVRVPLPDLLPGTYKLLVTVRGGRSLTEVYYEVPFVVPTTCATPPSAPLTGVAYQAQVITGAIAETEFGSTPVPFPVPGWLSGDGVAQTISTVR